MKKIITRRDFLAGLFGALGCSIVKDGYQHYKSSLETRVSAPLGFKTAGLESKDPELLWAAGQIKDVMIEDFLRDYIKLVTPKSSSFKDVQEEYGEKYVLDSYVAAHVSCLQTAIKKHGKRTPEDLWTILGGELANKQDTLSRKKDDPETKISHVNHLAPDVVKVYVKWGEHKTGLFTALLEASKEVKRPESLQTLEEKRAYVRSLMQEAFTREEYERYVEDFHVINNKLYDELRESIPGLERFLGFWKVRGEINWIKACTQKVYNDTILANFPEKQGGKR